MRNHKVEEEFIIWENRTLRALIEVIFFLQKPKEKKEPLKLLPEGDGICGLLKPMHDKLNIIDPLFSLVLVLVESNICFKENRSATLVQMVKQLSNSHRKFSSLTNGQVQEVNVDLNQMVVILEAPTTLDLELEEEKQRLQQCERERNIVDGMLNICGRPMFSNLVNGKDCMFMCVITKLAECLCVLYNVLSYPDQYLKKVKSHYVPGCLPGETPVKARETFLADRASFKQRLKCFLPPARTVAHSSLFVCWGCVKKIKKMRHDENTYNMLLLTVKGNVEAMYPELNVNINTIRNQHMLLQQVWEHFWLWF